MALDNVLANIPGLGGYLAMEQYKQQQALGGLQGALGVLNAVRAHDEAQQQAQLRPLQMQLMQAQVGEHQQRLADAQRKSAFYSPENMAQFMMPGSPGEAPGQGQTGGIDDGAMGQIMAPKQATLPQLDLNRLVTAGAAAGVIAPETLLNHQSQLQERAAAREQRMQELILRMNDARATAQERIQAQRDIAQMQVDARRDMAHLAASLRQPRVDPLVQAEFTDPSDPTKKITRYVPQSQAAGMSPPTTGGAEKPLTEFQGKAMLYGTRSAQADKILRSLEDTVSTVGLAAKQTAQGIPVLGGVLGAAGNAMLSSEQQRVEQAQRDFVNAVLRQESGAVISDAEFANAKKQYFPQPGDTKEVRDQKRRNREIAINGFKRMAGPGGADIDAMRNEPLLPGKASNPDIDALVRKYSG